MLLMELYNLKTMTKEESTRSPLSVALGNFDGVHRGHAMLIKHAILYARQRSIKSAVWTFADSGASLPNKPDAKCITPMREKLELIRALGADYAILEDFSAIRDYSPERFVKEILMERLGAVCAVCGFNFRFGHKGAGDCNALKRLMVPFDCVIVPPVRVNGQLVNSSTVRTLIENGDMESAAVLLGHDFSINLPVTEGKKLGRTIGIPTLNQNFPEGHIIPKYGIYACKAHVYGKEYVAVANIGIRPSIETDAHKVNCETHIIGYSGELYGEYVRVSLCKRLRDEMKFPDIDALKCAIEKDIAAAQEYFKAK